MIYTHQTASGVRLRVIADRGPVVSYLTEYGEDIDLTATEAAALVPRPIAAMLREAAAVIESRAIQPHAVTVSHHGVCALVPRPSEGMDHMLGDGPGLVVDGLEVRVVMA